MTPDRRSAFTLLELMIVLVILAILGAAFLTVSSSVFDKATVTEAQQRINALSTMVESYRTIEGEYPRDRLPDGAATNDTNTGAEALFVAFFDSAYTGQAPDQKWLSNTDEDTSTEGLTSLGGRELFEICDPWGNPIAYFESLHYTAAAGSVYWAKADGMDFAEEQSADPGRDERTGSFSNANSFQLVSAGPDGWFGTEDDITNYK